MKRTAPAFALCSALSLAALPAAAQTGPDAATRRALVQQADAAQRSGDHAQALAFGVEAGRLRWTPSLRMLVAQEHLALGHTVDALDAATACVVETTADRALRNRARILAACRAVVTQTEARVGRVRLVLPDDAPLNLRLHINGQEVAQSLWASSIPVPVGHAEVVAEGDGMLPFRAGLDVLARTEQQVRVSFRPVPPPPPPPPPVQPAPPPPIPLPPPVVLAPPPPAPPTVVLRPAPRAPAEVTYRAPLLLVDLLGAGIIGLGAGLGSSEAAITGASVGMLGAPVIHAIHRRPAAAIGSFGLRAGVVGLGALVGYATGESARVSDVTVPIYIGMGVGYFIAAIVDAAALGAYQP
jgi:hypothetical protein